MYTIYELGLCLFKQVVNQQQINCDFRETFKS